MAAASAAPRIFVSYARSDGKEIAADLRRRLQAEGFALWQDLTDMEGGKDWWRQITGVIDQTEYLLLVMTPNALRSKVVRDEWRYGRQQGRCVIPIKGVPDLEYNQLAGWMRRTHFVEVTQKEQWDRLVGTLRGPCQATRVPFMVDDLPDNFVARTNELDALIAELLDKDREEPVAITAALRGAGGYGKTTLARAICHDERIQDAYHDGVLWVTLGEDPGDLGGRVADLIHTLTGRPEAFATQDAAVNRLRETLADRRLLIVIDDVWNVAHARPFLQGGPTCARLITTRYAAALTDDARQIRVDAMQAGEAVELLHPEPPADQLHALSKLAARLGEWPLLLQLAASALRARRDLGQPLADAIAYVNRALDRKGLTAFDAREPEDRHQAVAATLRMSLDQLVDEDRERFEALAIFPEDVDVPLSTAELLWGLDDFDTEDLCQRLFSLSLLWSLELATRRLRLHDVVRSYLCDQQEDRMLELHARLIEAYRTKCPDGWHTGPDDGYFFQHLPYHLAEASRAEELQDLLFDYCWLRAKLDAVDLPGLIQDFEQLGIDEQARKMAAGLRLAAHALASDPRQFPGQLLGRFAIWDGPRMATLLSQARKRTDRPTLLPLRSTLTPPGTALIRILAGHSGPVTSLVALSERGQALSAGIDGTVRLWELASGREMQRFVGHRGAVMAVAALPQRDQALSASERGTVRLWNLDSGHEVQRFEGNSRWVGGLAVLPEGGQALSAEADGTVRLWDLESGEEVQRFAGHSGCVWAVAALPERGQALSAGDDGTVRLWNLASGQEVQRLEGHSGRVRAVAVLPGGGQALSAGDDGTVRLWDLESGEEVQRFAGPSGCVWAVAALPERGQALSAGDDGTVRLWDLESGKEVQRFESHSDRVGALVALPERSQALSAGDDGTVRLWDLEGVREVQRFDGHSSGVRAVAVLPGGREALSAGGDGTVRLWDLVSGEEVRRLEGHSGWVGALAILPERRQALSTGSDVTIRLWDLDSGKEVQRFESHSGLIRAMAALPERNQVILAGMEMVRLWDLANGEDVQRFEGHRGWVSAVAYVPEHGQVLSAGDDGTVRLWDIASGRAEQFFDGHSGLVTAVAAIPERGQALSAGSDGTVRLWDLVSGEEVQGFERHGGVITAVAVMPGGGQGLSAGYDGTARLWCLESGELLATFTADAQLSCCAVMRDLRLAVVGDLRGQIHVLEILL